ncbi:hypothetical protein SAMN06265375_10548 [Muriicola jejuensis]|nr:hypothetical protein SAMN06265375_10548 [Muriicola jejuensis]
MYGPLRAVIKLIVKDEMNKFDDSLWFRETFAQQRLNNKNEDITELGIQGVLLMKSVQW